MKETFYFSHDYNSRDDAKVLNMMSVLGYEGYGLFWVIIEKLAEAQGVLDLKDVKGMAYSLRTEEEKLLSIIKDFELFLIKDEKFYSKRLLEHIKKRDNLSKVRAKLGRFGGLAKAKQLLSKPLANCSKVKESKVKESKVNISIAEASSALKPIPNLLEDKQKHIQIIGIYARAKKIDFASKEQQSSYIRRNLRAARDLSGYEMPRIIQVMDYLLKTADFKWTLESVGKYIDEDLNNLITRQSKIAIIN